MSKIVNELNPVLLPSNVSNKSSNEEEIQPEIDIPSSTSIGYIVESDETGKKNLVTKAPTASGKEPHGNSSDNPKQVKNNEEVEENEDEEEESDNNDGLDYDSDDDPMEFGNFGLNDPEETATKETEDSQFRQISSQSGAGEVNKEQAKMELFWKLMDMGFSRERTVEAIHEKGFTEVEAAAEYLLTTGNFENFSVEKLAPKEHKYEQKAFIPLNQVQFSKAVSREANLLTSSLPDGIYVRAFEDRMDLYSVMIKGPQKTPYEDGLFFFDVQLSPGYPKLPPCFHYHSYSRRLNPNLYEEGKVCVSLLGTWSGQGSENWDPNNSNLLQVLVSIQGLILVNEPYFNEPGYASQKGTNQGTTKSRQYNEMVLLENLSSLTRLAENPPNLFYNEVREHLNETSESLTKRLETWIKNCNHPNKTSSSTANSSQILPEFPLAPISSAYATALKRSLELFEKSVQKMLNKNVLSTD